MYRYFLTQLAPSLAKIVSEINYGCARKYQEPDGRDEWKRGRVEFPKILRTRLPFLELLYNAVQQPYKICKYTVQFLLPK